MRRVLIFTAFILVGLTASCSGQKTLFHDFVEKFPSKELPLSIPHGCSDRSANDPSNLSRNELVSFLKIDTGIWLVDDKYYYNAGCRFSVSSDLESFLYFRSYLPFDFSKQRSECVLAVFQDAQLIDTLIIQGSIGDDLSFKSIITKELEITVLFEQLTLDESGLSHSTSSTKKYRINNSGEIVPIEAETKN